MSLQRSLLTLWEKLQDLVPIRRRQEISEIAYGALVIAVELPPPPAGLNQSLMPAPRAVDTSASPAVP
jgi:hypothetical protein